MFSGDPFVPTYTGPIYASGDLMRRSRNMGMAQSEFAGNQRAFRPMAPGIGAGSAIHRYQAGIGADTARAKGFADAQQAIADNAAMMANANLQYQTNAADEASGIRGLLLKNRQVDQNTALDMRELGINTELANFQRSAENEAARLRRKASVGGILAGLFR